MTVNNQTPRAGILSCQECGGDGREWRSHYGGNDPDVWDVGPCPACDGTGEQTCEDCGERPAMFRHVERGRTFLLCAACHNDLDAVVHELGIEDSDTTTPVEAVRALKAELEEMTLGRGRLRLWLEFIQHNCTSPEAREYAGAALNGAHVPEGYDWDERSGRHDFLP